MIIVYFITLSLSLSLLQIVYHQMKYMREELISPLRYISIHKMVVVRLLVNTL